MNGQQRRRTAVAKAVFRGAAMAVVPAMATLVDGGLVRRVVDPSGRRAPPEVAHACPLSDPCAGSNAANAWATIMTGLLVKIGGKGSR